MRNLLLHRFHRLVDAYYRFMHRHFLPVLITGFALGIAPLVVHQFNLLPTFPTLAISLPLLIISSALSGIAGFLDGHMYDAEAEKADRIIYRRTQLRRKYPELRIVTDDMIDMLYPV